MGAYFSNEGPLAFTGGTWDPAALGDYAYTLERSGAVGDAIGLTSRNPGAVTVPASVDFAAGSNTVSFNATVASLTAGDATIVAINAATGAWAEYTVRPVAPSLSIGGPWQLSAPGAATFTLTRSASVGGTVLLSSSDPGVLWVPADLLHSEGYFETTFPATARANGTSTITASNVSSGAWTTYDVTVAAAPAPSRRIIRIGLRPI